MRRRLAAPAALAVLTLGLAACAGDDGTGPVTEAPPTLIDNDDASDGGGSSDSGDSKASGGGGSAEAAPDIPAPNPEDYPDMDEETKEGARQAFRYYMDTAWWSHKTGESERLDSLATENCGVCADAVDDVREMKEKGAYWSDFETDVSELRARDANGQEGVDYLVLYVAVNSPHSEPDFSTGEVEEVPEKRYMIAAGLVWDGELWLVDGMSAENEEL